MKPSYSNTFLFRTPQPKLRALPSEPAISPPLDGLPRAHDGGDEPQDAPHGETAAFEYKR